MMSGVQRCFCMGYHGGGPTKVLGWNFRILFGVLNLQSPLVSASLRIYFQEYSWHIRSWVMKIT